MTRPDVAYSVSIVSPFMSSPTIVYWKALRQILCYLKGAPGRGLFYSNHEYTNIKYFSDANWAGSKVDRRLTTGFCIFIGGNLVSWRSKKQNVVSRSNAELEYRAMTQYVSEVIWIRQLLNAIGHKISMLAKLCCDNQAAIHIVSNPVFH